MIKDTLTLVIFGATGDLTMRKLLPALYNLTLGNLLPENTNIVCLGRRDYTNIEYGAVAKSAINNFSRTKVKDEIWEKFIPKLSYVQIDYSIKENFQVLRDFLDKQKENSKGNIQYVYYLAVAPEHFEPIVTNLKLYGLSEARPLAPRLVIEKPFGRDLKSAKQLNDKIINVFSEENTYRIDHYLGKEMMQNIMVIRFSNLIFEAIWNNKYIKQVQINSSETIGIGNRGNYYEQSGAIRDMVQSHLLQLVSLIAMEQPKSLNTFDIRNEKIKVLKALKSYTKTDFATSIVRGQYRSYVDEPNVQSNSRTETYVALKLFINNKRWQGVPFVIRTGKKLPQKSTEIIIEFKDVKDNLYTHALPNMLIFKIQPDEGVSLSFNAKKVGNTDEIIPVEMDFCQNCEIGFNSPEAYERLLYDVMRGEATLFAHWDEVEYSWKFIDTIINYWQKENPPLYIYDDGTWGPDAANNLPINSHWIKI